MKTPNKKTAAGKDTAKGALSENPDTQSEAKPRKNFADEDDDSLEDLGDFNGFNDFNDYDEEDDY